ncbi:MAG: hypothetical protein HY901_28080, partial [Deltaproteobacteria bacterium]|nr:hypothetical protein [Deltaproteobacteria bacterium]
MPLAATSADAVFELQAVPEGWTGRLSADGKSLSLKAPYGATGEISISLSIDCGEETVTASLPVTGRRLEFAPIKSWSGGVDSPVGREYFAMWIDSEVPDRLLLYGGFHYSPRAVGTDLWELDLASETWKQLPSNSSALALAGAGFALIPKTRDALFYGGITAAGKVQYSLKRLHYP